MACGLASRFLPSAFARIDAVVRVLLLAAAQPK